MRELGREPAGADPAAAASDNPLRQPTPPSPRGEAEPTVVALQKEPVELAPRLPMIVIGSKLLAHQACPFIGVLLGIGNAWSRLSEAEQYLQGEGDNTNSTPLDLLCKSATQRGQLPSSFGRQLWQLPQQSDTWLARTFFWRAN